MCGLALRAALANWQRGSGRPAVRNLKFRPCPPQSSGACMPTMFQLPYARRTWVRGAAGWRMVTQSCRLHHARLQAALLGLQAGHVGRQVGHVGM